MPDHLRPLPILMLLLGIVGPCTASGGAGEYELPWSNKHEFLRYRSCGCGDACWVAEVRDRKTQRVISRLSCDCTSLSYANDGRMRERPLHESCEDMNASANKPALIKEKLENLRQPLRER